MSFRCWPARLALILAGLTLLVGGLNLLVDPYMIYGLVNLPGLNANKSIAPNHSRTIKPYLIEDLQPRGVILGSSRAEVAMDPGHPGWGTTRPVFNSAVGGLGIEELAARFEGALDRAPIEKALIGLDFYMFNAFLGDLTPAYEIRGRANLYFRTLLTINALKASFDTLRKQDPVKSPGMLPTGQIAWTFNDHRVAKQGHRSSFLRFERHFLEDTFFPNPHRQFGFYDPYKQHDAFASFRKILALARDRKVELHLYISPIHARILETIRQSGLWPEYEAWKRSLVTILAEDARLRADGTSVPLIDFSGINSVTTEAVPVLGDTQTHMTYYWECSHFKKQTGDLIQDVVWGVEREGVRRPADFGVELNEQNVDRLLEETLTGLDLYLKDHPDSYDDIARAKAASTWRDKR